MKSYMYIIRVVGTNICKIGKAGNVKTRLRQLQTGNHKVLELVGTVTCTTSEQALSLERHFHLSYKDSNIRGEWFTLNSCEVSSILIEGGSTIKDITEEVVVSLSEVAVKVIDDTSLRKAKAENTLAIIGCGDMRKVICSNDIYKVLDSLQLGNWKDLNILETKTFKSTVEAKRECNIFRNQNLHNLVANDWYKSRCSRYSQYCTRNSVSYHSSGYLL